MTPIRIRTRLWRRLHLGSRRDYWTTMLTKRYETFSIFENIESLFKDIPDWQSKLKRDPPKVQKPKALEVEPPLTKKVKSEPPQERNYFADLVPHFQSREQQLEIQFFEKLRSRLKLQFSEDGIVASYFNEIMKVIFLFHESIITL